MSHGLCCEPDCPVSLYQSLQGKYFVGMSSEAFGDGKYAWAGLFNPSCSGVLLFVNVFTVSNPSEIPFSFQIWLNAQTSGLFSLSELVSPSNTAICPIPEPKHNFCTPKMWTPGPPTGLWSSAAVVRRTRRSSRRKTENSSSHQTETFLSTACLRSTVPIK